MWCLTLAAFGLVVPRGVVGLSLPLGMDRRSMLAGGGAAVAVAASEPASAVVYLDPARYGDQELKNAAIAKCRTRVRDAVVADPTFAGRFFLLSLMDGLSYDEKRRTGGPDARVAASIQVAGEPYAELREALDVLTESQKALRRTNALTLADLIALAGAEAVAAVGGPEISVQLGRTDSETLLEDIKAVKKGGIDEASKRKIVPAIDLEKAKKDPSIVLAAFRRSGLSEREATALLGTLAVLDSVTELDLAASAAPKARGKIGRGGGKATKAPLVDLYGTADGDEEPDVDKMEGDLDDFYIADAFGTKKDAYGKRANSAKSSEANFNQFFVSLESDSVQPTSWVESAILSDPNSKIWINKYSTERLTYIKDVSKTFYRITQLGAQYTGGKYAALLDNREIAKLN